VSEWLASRGLCRQSQRKCGTPGGGSLGQRGGTRAAPRAAPAATRAGERRVDVDGCSRVVLEELQAEPVGRDLQRQHGCVRVSNTPLHRLVVSSCPTAAPHPDHSHWHHEGGKVHVVSARQHAVGSRCGGSGPSGCTPCSGFTAPAHTCHLTAPAAGAWGAAAALSTPAGRRRRAVVCQPGAAVLTRRLLLACGCARTREHAPAPGALRIAARPPAAPCRPCAIATTRTPVAVETNVRVGWCVRALKPLPHAPYPVSLERVLPLAALWCA
jgi:hypothetical protein